MRKTLYERVARGVGALERRLGWLPSTAARVTVGWIFVQSGWGKLHSLDQVVKFFTDLGIPAPQIQAPFAAGTEFVCGSLVLLGLATRVAALPLMAGMTVALSPAPRGRVGKVSALFPRAGFLPLVLRFGPRRFSTRPCGSSARGPVRREPG